MLTYKRRIHALSQWQFNATMKSKNITDGNVHEYTSTAFIQIMGEHDSHHPDCALHFKKNHPNVLTLFFDDVDEPLNIEDLKTGNYIPITPMNEAQGGQIISFARSNEDKRTFLVHCAAGVSRSGAVAKFLCEFFGMESKDFYEMNPHTHPNQRIINILRNLSQKS